MSVKVSPPYHFFMCPPTLVRVRVRSRVRSHARKVASRKALNASHTYIAKVVTLDLRGDALVVERAELVLIRDLDLLLRARLRVRDVELRVTKRSLRLVFVRTSISRSRFPSVLFAVSSNGRPFDGDLTTRKKPSYPPRRRATARSTTPPSSRAFRNPRDRSAGFLPRPRVAVASGASAARRPRARRVRGEDEGIATFTAREGSRHTHLHLERSVGLRGRCDRVAVGSFQTRAVPTVTV